MDIYPGIWYDFEWDEAKREGNLAKHGIDFADVVQAFDGRPRIDGPSTRNVRFSEDRHVTIAEIEGVVVAIVWTWRDRAMRFISARVARRVERTHFAESINGQD